MSKNKAGSGYKIEGLVDSDEIPDWARRPAKWADLIEAVMELEPGGRSLQVEFEDEGVANKARNTVRDTLNLRLKKAAIRTRLVKDPNSDKATVFFTKLHDDEIVEAE